MNRKRAVTLILIALISGLAAMLGASHSITKMADRRAAPEPQNLVEVIVAGTDIRRGEPLRREHLKNVSWPASLVLPSAARRIEDVENRVSLVNLIQGEPILTRKLAPPGSPSGLASFVSPGMRAVTVRVNEVIGVGGFVTPGSRVDVLTTIDIGTEKGLRTTVTKMVLQNIRVLATDKQLDPPPAGSKESKPKKVSVATLLVTPGQAEHLTLAATRGQILLALRNTTDKMSVKTSGVTPRELVHEKVAALSPPKPPPAKKPKPAKAKVSKPAPKPVVRVEVIRGGKRSFESFGPPAGKGPSRPPAKKRTSSK